MKSPSSKQGSADVFSSLPSTPSQNVLNCLNITFHTSKQEATFPTFKTGFLPSHEVAGLVNSIQATPKLCLARGSRGSTFKLRELEPCLDFTFPSAEWEDTPIICSKPSRPQGNIWGNLKVEHYLGQWPLEVTIAISKFKYTAYYPANSGRALILQLKSYGPAERGTEFHFTE